MPRTIGLTSRQAQVLDAIDTLTHANGYPPTVREIAAYVGLASPSSVHYHLVTLQEAGLVTHPPERPRTWLTRSTEPALR